MILKADDTALEHHFAGKRQEGVQVRAEGARRRLGPVHDAGEVAVRLLDDDVTGTEVLVQEDDGKREYGRKGVDGIPDSRVEPLGESSQEELELALILLAGPFLPRDVLRCRGFP